MQGGGWTTQYNKQSMFWLDVYAAMEKFEMLKSSWSAYFAFGCKFEQKEKRQAGN